MFPGLYSYLYLTSLVLLIFKLYNDLELEYELYIVFLPAIGGVFFSFIEDFLRYLKKDKEKKR